ncbi:hypothetical protein CU664_28155 [Pseudomonas syringae pv. actinidifoliorum]|nr:hypothetical protein [Pseudomonas syringae pv. actinidifoliorum]NAT66855.1 hypothetical protein [Pseudomonas syringae pv. actinidifoliorum]
MKQERKIEKVAVIPAYHFISKINDLFISPFERERDRPRRSLMDLHAGECIRQRWHDHKPAFMARIEIGHDSFPRR